MKLAACALLALFATPQAQRSDLPPLPIGIKIRLLDADCPRESFHVREIRGNWIACELSAESSIELAHADPLLITARFDDYTVLRTEGDLLNFLTKQVAECEAAIKDCEERIRLRNAPTAMMEEEITKQRALLSGWTESIEATDKRIQERSRDISEGSRSRPYWFNLSAVKGLRAEP